MKDKLQAIVDHFGVSIQLLKFAEEFGEVCQAINRYEAGKVTHTKDITEEVADLEVMIDQIKVIYNLDESDIAVIKEQKVDRTIQRYNIGGTNMACKNEKSEKGCAGKGCKGEKGKAIPPKAKPKK